MSVAESLWKSNLKMTKVSSSSSEWWPMTVPLIWNVMLIFFFNSTGNQEPVMKGLTIARVAVAEILWKGFETVSGPLSFEWAMTVPLTWNFMLHWTIHQNLRLNLRKEWSDLPSLVSNSDSEELVHAEFDDNDIIIFDDIQIYGGHVTNEYQLRGLPHAHIILTPPRPSLHWALTGNFSGGLEPNCVTTFLL